MNAVEVRGLSKTFKSGRETVHALRNVSLEIRDGEIFGLLGPNGAGKTTLISTLIGLTTADTGSVRVLGMEVEKHRHEVQQAINLVSGFGGTLRDFTGTELMRYYAMLYNTPHAEKKIAELLHVAGLWDKRNQYVSKYSSGFKQRFFIAKSLLNDPQLLLLDEPTVGLDVEMARQVRSLTRKLNREGRTILLTTHYMKEAEELCDRIALIAGGRIVALGTAKELKALVKKEEAVEVGGRLGQSLCSKLSKLDGVIGYACHGEKTRLLVKEARVINAVMRQLVESGAEVDYVRREEATLEDVFIKLTRKGLENGSGEEQ